MTSNLIAQIGTRLFQLPGRVLAMTPKQREWYFCKALLICIAANFALPLVGYTIFGLAYRLRLTSYSSLRRGVSARSHQAQFPHSHPFQ